jgi:hypothetical protein
MSFRINNDKRQVLYYTILLESNLELRDKNRIIPKKNPSPYLSQPMDSIVFDRHSGKWKTSTRFG